MRSPITKFSALALVAAGLFTACGPAANQNTPIGGVGNPLFPGGVNGGCAPLTGAIAFTGQGYMDSASLSITQAQVGAGFNGAGFGAGFNGAAGFAGNTIQLTNQANGRIPEANVNIQATSTTPSVYGNYMSYQAGPVQVTGQLTLSALKLQQIVTYMQAYGGGGFNTGMGWGAGYNYGTMPGFNNGFNNGFNGVNPAMTQNLCVTGLNLQRAGRYGNLLYGGRMLMTIQGLPQPIDINI